MKKLATIIILLVLTSCHGEAISSEQKGDYQVELLFEQDGIKVYRFRDERYHYFTSKGETITTQSTGKTTYQENIK